MNLERLKRRLEEVQVRAKKQFGQNFLISEMVIKKITDSVRAAKPSFVIEIGPGMGALTEPLADLTPLLIELDTDLAEYWRSRSFQLIENDALKVNWDELSIPENTWLVSNLPYQISTTLLIDRCFGPKHLQGMILMFQKEVAQRLTAVPRTPEYGLLSVMAQLGWEISKVADASPRDFHPAPKIASRVLKFKRKDVLLEPKFLTFLKAAFSHRRKFLLKNLGQLGHKLNWADLLVEMNISPKARAEELTPSQFAELYRRWKSI